MMNTKLLPLLLAARASATYLYVTSYAGTVTTLDLEASSNGTTLKTISTSDGCGSSPTWLTLRSEDGTLFCLDEGFATWPNGTVVSFSTNGDGSLEQLDSEATLNGPVSSVLYGNGDAGLAVAYYSGSAFGTWDTSDAANLTLLTDTIFELDGPGTDPDRQEAPHPHEAITDPTGKYILVPDLGADLIRIYDINEEDLSVTAVDPLSVPAGSGPRHAAFAVHGETTYFYFVTELSNMIYGYTVTYGDGGLSFEQVYESGTHGKDGDVPASAGAAEIHVTPDQNFLIVSSRNESIFEIPNFDPTNSTKIVSDTLINFSIDASTGDLTKLQEVAAGGRFPRQFSLNEDASLVAVGLQSDGRVVVIERDVESGELGNFVASTDVEGEVTCVIFNELK